MTSDVHPLANAQKGRYPGVVASPLGHAEHCGVPRLQRIPGRHAASPATLRSRLRCGPAHASLRGRSSRCDSPLCARIRLLPHDGLPECLQPRDTAAAEPREGPREDLRRSRIAPSHRRGGPREHRQHPQEANFSAWYRRPRPRRIEVRS
jgi:hypothetical protein